jgi:hypothetical protein
VAIGGIVIAAAMAAPVSAARPDHWTEVVQDDWLQAECDGYDVWQHNVVTLHLSVFFDADGDVVREVTRADSTGVIVREYPDGSTIQVATYRDLGGTFTFDGDDFTWTGVIDSYVTRDGSRYQRIGRQTLHVISWDPWEFEWTSDVGLHEDWDPCTW